MANTYYGRTNRPSEQGSERERLYDAERDFREAIADSDDDRSRPNHRS